LAQVLSNLLTNAAKYTDPEGSSTLIVMVSAVHEARKLSPPTRLAGFHIDPRQW
jgi:signal transduction histidine kinase